MYPVGLSAKISAVISQLFLPLRYTCPQEAMHNGFIWKHFHHLAQKRQIYSVEPAHSFT